MCLINFINLFNNSQSFCCINFKLLSLSHRQHTRSFFFFFFCNLGLRRAAHNELRARSVKPLQFLTINLREVTITELQTSRSPFCQPCTFSDCECCSYFCQFGDHFPVVMELFCLHKNSSVKFCFPCLLISFSCILLNI